MSSVTCSAVTFGEMRARVVHRPQTAWLISSTGTSTACRCELPARKIARRPGPRACGSRPCSAGRSPRAGRRRPRSCPPSRSTRLPAKFVVPTMNATTPVVTAPTVLIAMLNFHPGSLSRSQWMHHAALRQREREEHAERVERDERVDAGVEDDEQHDRHHAQHDNPVREREPVAAEEELVRQKRSRARIDPSRGKSA